MPDVASMFGVADATASSAEYIVLLLGAGLVIGLYHALEPDHVSAISAIITGGRRAKITGIQSAGNSISRGAMHGIIWGFGHTSAIFLVVMMVFVFALNIPDHVFGIFEMAVGAMLVALGASTVAGSKIPILSGLRLHKHVHMHEHEDGTVHSHPHGHDGRINHHGHGHRSYAVGCIHGLAGSGGLVAVAAASMADGTATAIHAPLLFASVFGAGSIMGMSAVAGLLALLFAACSSAGRARDVMRYASGAGAVVFGAYVMTVRVMHAWQPI